MSTSATSIAMLCLAVKGEIKNKGPMYCLGETESLLALTQEKIPYVMRMKKTLHDNIICNFLKNKEMGIHWNVVFILLPRLRQEQVTQPSPQQ